MNKVLKTVAILAGIALVVVGVTLFSLYEASQQVPEFYREAIAQDPRDQGEARDQFVAETTALASDLHRARPWQHLFTAEQINAWLALELSANYPDMLSGELSEPRIELRSQEATIACRYETGTMSAVLSLTVDAYLQEPNVLALRIRRARAGALPVPLTEVLDAISLAATQLKLRLEWRKEQGDPVALITFPQPRDSQSTTVTLQTVELRAGELFVAGAISPTRRGDHLAETQAAPDGKADGDAEEPELDQPLIGAAAKDTRQE